MGVYLNNFIGGKSYTDLMTSESKQKSKDLQDPQKKKQIVSVREGGYFCTYIVNSKGQKILINRVPIPQADEQKSSEKSIESDEIKSYRNNIVKNTRAAFEYKQQMNLEVTQEQNLQDMMDILKEYAGIPGNSNKTQNY